MSGKTPPWHIEDDNPDCDGYAVVADETGDIEKCHDTRQEAEDHMAALYANVEDAAGKGQQSMKRQFKAVPHFVKEIQDRTVTGIFAVHGNVDDAGDRSWPGAFANVTINGRNRVRFLWQHRSDEPPVAVVKSVREIGRDELPTAVLGYAPNATGGAEVAREYLDTPRGNEILTGIKAGAIDEMSYAYDPARVDFEELDDRQVRNLRELKLYDISDVLWGLNPATTSVKDWSGKDLSFSKHSEAVVSAIQEFAQRARDRRDFRAKEGRVLSEANRKRINSLLESLKQVSSDLEELLKLSEPKADQATINQLFAQYQRIRAQLNGVNFT